MRVVIIGLGLIGGSIGLALKESKWRNAEIIGYVRHSEVGEAALSMIKAGRTHELVAVRSSVHKEPHNSFAGVLDSFVNITGEEDIIKHVKMCWASLFFPQTRIYREKYPYLKMQHQQAIWERH